MLRAEDGAEHPSSVASGHEAWAAVSADEVPLTIKLPSSLRLG